MPVLKAPPRMIRNATIQVRVEEEVDLNLRKYAEFIDATPAFVVAESLKMVFNKDAEFREWLTQHGDKPTRARAEKAAPQEQTQIRSGIRTMFDEVPHKAATKEVKQSSVCPYIPQKRANHREALRAMGALSARAIRSRLWRVLGVGNHSYFLIGRYTRGTQATAIQEVQQFQREKMVPGVGVEPT